MKAFGIFLSVCLSLGHVAADVTIIQLITSYSTVCPCSTLISSSRGLSSTTQAPSLGSSAATATSASSATSVVSSIVVQSSTTIAASSTPAVVASSSSASLTSSAPAATMTIRAASLGDYQTTVLTLHNLHRRNHSATDLTWSASLAGTAQQIASSCVYEHNTAADGGGYGQNIGAGFTPEQIGFMITNAMYNGEMPFYPTPYGNDNPSLSAFGSWGHFSQEVWADTRQVGCYTQYCPNGLINPQTGQNLGTPPYFSVCNFSPPGNYLGQFSRVHAPLGGRTIVII